MDFLEKLWSFKLFVGTYITFLKGYDAGFLKNSKFSINSCFEKNFSGRSLCTRGAAGIWAVDLFSTTYFDEIIIFELSKDQTFRTRCTLMNPEKKINFSHTSTNNNFHFLQCNNSVLVPYLNLFLFVLYSHQIPRVVTLFTWIQNKVKSEWLY
jgi:hypothetical protein